MSLMTASFAALVTALALFLVLTTAYPTKDEEAYYYNRLHDLPDTYNKDVRNLDGIDSREEVPPLLALLAKVDQDASSERGSKSKYKFGSGSHLDGIGGGHLVRNLEMEQGLGSTIVDGALQPADVGVDVSETFGSIQRFPQNPTYSQDDYNIFHFLLSAETTPHHKVTYIPKPRPDIFHYLLSQTISQNSLTTKPIIPIQNKEYSVMKRDQDIFDENYLKHSRWPSHYDHVDPLGGGHLLGKRHELSENLSQEPFVYSRFMDPTEGRQKDLDYLTDNHIIEETPVYSRFMDALGGGHLLGSKRNVDSLGGGHLIKEPPTYSRFMDSLGGGHLIKETPVYSRFMDALGGGHLIKETPVYSRFMDALGGGHLLGSKRNVDSLGGGHLIKEPPTYSRFMDSLGGGHLIKETPVYSRFMDALGGGHLIKETPVYSRFMDALGGGHLLGSKRNVDSLGGGHLIKELPIYSRFMDSLGGGHLIKETPVYSRFMDALGGGHLLGSKRNVDSLGGGHLIKEPPTYSKFMDSLGGGHLIKETPVYSRFMDALGGGHLIKENPVYSRFMDALGGGHLLGSKRNVDSLGGGHLIKETPTYSRFMDALGGGHLIKETPLYSKVMDSLGSDHVLSSKKDLDYLGGGHLIKEPIKYSRFMDSLGGGHLLGTKKGLDSLGGGHLIREPLPYPTDINLLGEDHSLDAENDLDNFIKDQTVQSRITIKPTKDLFLNTNSDFDLFSKTYLSKYPFEYFRKIFVPIRSYSENQKPCLHCPYESSPINKESKPTKTMPTDSNVYQAKVLSVKITPNKEQISSNPLSYSESTKLSYDFPSEEESVEVTQTETPFKGVIDVNNLDIPHIIT